MAVGPVGQRVDRDEGPRQPQLGAVLQLLARLIDVVHVQHADPLEPVGRGLAEVRDPRIVRPAQRGQQLAVREAIPEQALARLQARAPDAVHLQLLEHGVGVVRPLSDVLPHTEEVDRRGILEPLARLDDRADGPDPRPLEVPGVVLPADACAMPLHAGSASAELRLDPALVQVGGLDDVRIGRDDSVAGHDLPPHRGSSSGSPC